MDENPMEQIANLQERVAQIARDAGLELEGFAVVPGKPGGPHFAQAIFALDPERAFKDAEDRKIDDEFQNMMRMERMQSHMDAVERIQETAGKDILADLENMGATVEPEPEQVPDEGARTDEGPRRYEGLDGLDAFGLPNKEWDDPKPEPDDLPPAAEATDEDFDAIRRRYESGGDQA